MNGPKSIKKIAEIKSPRFVDISPVDKRYTSNNDKLDDSFTKHEKNLLRAFQSVVKVNLKKDDVIRDSEVHEKLHKLLSSESVSASFKLRVVAYLSRAMQSARIHH